MPRNSPDCTAPDAKGSFSRGVCDATSAMIAGSTPLVAPIKNRETRSCNGVSAKAEIPRRTLPSSMDRRTFSFRPYLSPRIPQIGLNTPMPKPNTHPAIPAQNAARSVENPPRSSKNSG